MKISLFFFLFSGSLLPQKVGVVVVEHLPVHLSDIPVFTH
jgi:hypothetical protein